MKTSVLVVGAGAAGMLAAGFAGAGGADTILLERNDRPGRKVMITGKGRCNVTNDRRSVQELIANVPRNGRFLYGAFSRFMPEDVMEFFESRGVELKVERGGRVFPVSDKASDIVDALAAFAGRYSTIVKGRAVKLMLDGGEVSGVETEGGDKIYADKVIIATGGLSYPATGSTGDGYELARQAGHKVVPAVPSLVPLEIHEGFCSRLMGLSLRNVALKVLDTDKGGKEIYKDFGEMLFTHFGVSGPIVLSLSNLAADALAAGKDVELELDLKPALSEEKLDARIQRDFVQYSRKQVLNGMKDLLPQRLIPVVLDMSYVDENKFINQVSREERHRLLQTLKHFVITISATRPIAEAIVTAGGVSVKEIDPKTMESKRIKGLYFAGEVMDIDGYTGGYNLQAAFSSGHAAGEAAAAEE